MQITVAKHAGFCPGVKRAWKLVNNSLENKPVVYILGELIHNEQALAFLQKRGLVTLDNLQEISKVGNNDTLIIRAHGEPPKTYKEIEKFNLNFIDATCPCVARVQKLAEDLSKKGFFVVVCGEKDHPEAIATVSYTKNGIIISSPEEANELPDKKKIAVICQTTFSEGLFKNITAALGKKCDTLKSCGTICNFTKLAQVEAKRLAKTTDVAIVIGGKHSSNTVRLAEICAAIIPMHHIEMAGELEKQWFVGADKAALLAGASTPDWIIKEIVDKIGAING